jgi:beta-glucosidase
MSRFMFATGIENSYPVIAGGVRVDEMEKCGHYDHWREDLRLVRSMGLRHLRWGPPLHKTFVAPGRYDWAWTDEVMAEMARLRIRPVLDLCHFGVPDWLGDFQNPDLAPYLAEYATECARRYPHVRRWTPVNEPLVTTLFSAKYGWWNERQTTDRAFVRATLNVAHASRLCMAAIAAEIPRAVFVQSESCEYTHPSGPARAAEAAFLNERRFLPLDLIYGRAPRDDVREYLIDNGMTAAEQASFAAPLGDYDCILGVDYYALNEHRLRADGSTEASGETLGFHTIARQYYDRYRLPLMHTETNLREEQGSAAWLRKQWNCVLSLLQDGIPIVGFTWYSLTDQMDWDTALREDARRVDPVGLFDLDRKERPVGRLYRDLVGEWSSRMPAVAPVEVARPRVLVAA